MEHACKHAMDVLKVVWTYSESGTPLRSKDGLDGLDSARLHGLGVFLCIPIGADVICLWGCFSLAMLLVLDHFRALGSMCTGIWDQTSIG